LNGISRAFPHRNLYQPQWSIFMDSIITATLNSRLKTLVEPLEIALEWIEKGAKRDRRASEL
jgi:hypothetical protein